MPLITRQSPTRRGKVRPGQNVYAASASYAHVAAAVGAAAAGDTVIVPAGTETWASTLTIDKRLHLIGAGIGQTVITGNVGSSAYLVAYTPSDAFSNEWFRLSGFTFDSNNNSRLLNVYRNTVEAPTHIRIDHNRFIAATAFVPAWEIGGRTHGVVDNNVFEQSHHIDNYGTTAAGGQASWQNLTYVPGSADNLFYEDNDINVNFTFFTGGHGGRYCCRYNDFGLTDPDGGYSSLSVFTPLFDAHGNLSSACGTMGIDIYGNAIVSAWGNGFLDYRGGKACVFFNKITGSATAWNMEVYEEQDDADPGPATAPDGTPQQVNHGYFWNNRYGTTGTTLFHASEIAYGIGGIEENTDWWNHATSFDGTVGVGCGTIGDRPATCTIGVGYWATTQDCTAISDDHIGKAPATPISGTLYIATATNVWSEYYTPYTYPHPFRSA